MLFLADENIPMLLVKELRKAGHDVKDLKEEKLFGTPDKKILETAFSENRIILTLDKDFLHLAEQNPFSHKGIILLRFSDKKPQNIIRKFIPQLKRKHSGKFKNSVTIVSDGFIEIIQEQQKLND